MAGLNDIARWRIQVFSRLLSLVAVLASVTAVPSIAVAARDGLWPVVAMDLGALAGVLALWRLTRLPYALRVLGFLAIIYLVGVGLMLAVGPISQVYLLAAPVLAAVLLGMWPALAMLGLSGATILALSLAGKARLYVTGMPDYELMASAVVCANYLFIGTLITVACATLLRHLARSLDELRGFADSLAHNQNELRSANAELRLTAAAVAQLNDLVVIAKRVEGPGAAQPVIFANDAFERRTGFQRAEVVGRGLRALAGQAADPAEMERIVGAIEHGAPVTAELFNHTKSGEAYWLEVELVPFADEGGNNTHWVAVGRDITERKNSASAIHRLAFFDALTGLPNRRMLMERLDKLLAGAHAGAGFGAVMFIDLDHFKFVNDARGHATGDALLRTAAERLAQLVRKGDTVARLGGDEFVVCLAQLGHGEDEAVAAALAVAEKIRRALAEDMLAGDECYSSSASIGVALLPRPGQSVHDLLREADTAMYRAKAGGRNGVAFFESSMQDEMERRLTLERDLGLALERGELAMHLQLQVDRDGAPAGAELLMRWRRPDGSMVPPDVFIPVAERTGLILELGRWALHQACLGWQRLAQAGHRLPLSVNVSPSQFRQPGFVDQVRALLADTGTPPGQLIFEVTEGLLIDSLDETIARMHQLAALGIRFSIDDFGTGYSNLAYLKRMPLYELKIDKSFIRDTPGDANGAAIVQSILAMAGHLGLRVIAEGVETAAQAGFLSEHGSPGMQGYLFARPMPLADLVALLDARSAALPDCPATLPES